MTDAETGLIEGPDGQIRCAWHGNLPDYLHYHDHEWGKPVDEDRRLFEKLCLEGFQSGLSWLTILRKRDNFRAAFHNFEFEKLAGEGEAFVEEQVLNAGIIRHRGKIQSVLNNARRAVEMREEHGSLARWFWAFEPGAEMRPGTIDRAFMRANPTTEISTRISKELKKKGWSFVGPTTVYAFMQAMGLVNDHLEGCICRPIVERERAQFRRPV